MSGDVRSAEGGGAGLACDFGVAVDDGLAEIGEEFGGAVAAGGEFEESGSLFEEAGGDIAVLEGVVVDDIFEEGDVGLDAPDAELTQGPIHALAGFGEVSAPGGCFDEE